MTCVIRGALVAMVAALFGVPAAAAVSPASPAATTHIYDSHHPGAIPAYITSDRGPPAVHERHVTCDAAEIRSHGAFARSNENSKIAPYRYDDTARFVQITWGRRIALALGGASVSRLAAVQSERVAANGATSPVGRKVVTKEFEDGVTTRYGWEMPVAPGANAPGVIGGRAYSGHALDQMQSRGFVPSVVEDTIGLGVSAPSRGATVYYGSANNVSVVLNSNGRVITVSYGDL